MATLLQSKRCLSQLGRLYQVIGKSVNEDDFQRPYSLKSPLYRQDIPALFAFLID
jgi:hypothetical protein